MAIVSIGIDAYSSMNNIIVIVIDVIMIIPLSHYLATSYSGIALYCDKLTFGWYLISGTMSLRNFPGKDAWHFISHINRYVLHNWVVM